MEEKLINSLYCKGKEKNRMKNVKNISRKFEIWHLKEMNFCGIVGLLSINLYNIVIFEVKGFQTINYILLNIFLIIK